MTSKSDPAIAIIGGGLMGYGIAFVFASAGYAVSVYEPDAERRSTLPEKIAGLCTLLGVAPGSLGPVSYPEDLKAAVGNAAMVIEAAPENLDIKRKIFADIDALAPADAILATNTSAIPISKIAEAAVNRDRVIGAHFWNPPHLIELVEIIVGAETDIAYANRAMEIMARVGMTPVLVLKDVPGFIGNRLQHALKREAIALVANGICDAETVDTVTKLGFGKRLPVMGPLEQSDLLGLELTVAIHNTIIPDLDVTQTVHPYLKERIASGKNGAKSGEGFRKWTDAEATAARTKMNEYLVEGARARYAARSETAAKPSVS
jgi:3-hydroxybutyryl-CoA dehydrogenase